MLLNKTVWKQVNNIQVHSLGHILQLFTRYLLLWLQLHFQLLEAIQTGIKTTQSLTGSIQGALQTAVWQQ